MKYLLLVLTLLVGCGQADRDHPEPTEAPIRTETPGGVIEESDIVTYVSPESQKQEECLVILHELEYGPYEIKGNVLIPFYKVFEEEKQIEHEIDGDYIHAIDARMSVVAGSPFDKWASWAEAHIEGELVSWVDNPQGYEVHPEFDGQRDLSEFGSPITAMGTIRAKYPPVKTWVKGVLTLAALHCSESSLHP